VATTIDNVVAKANALVGGNNETHRGMGESFRLFQIWALQRGMWRSVLDTTDTYAILLYLYRTKRASPRYTPLQTLTHVWKFFLHDDDDNAAAVATAAGAAITTTMGRCHIIPGNATTAERQTIEQCALANRYRQLARETPDAVNAATTLVELWQQSAPIVLLDPSMQHNYTNYSRADWMTRHSGWLRCKCLPLFIAGPS
jgi:hypothetical protein